MAARHGKVITRTMMEDLAAKKATPETTPAANEPKKRGRKPKSETTAIAADTPKKRGRKPKFDNTASAATAKRGRKSKAEAVAAAKPKRPNTKAKAESVVSKVLKKRGPKPKNSAVLKPAKGGSTRRISPKATAVQSNAKLEIGEALPGAIVTLTITGTIEAIQNAVTKLQN